MRPDLPVAQLFALLSPKSALGNRTGRVITWAYTRGAPPTLFSPEVIVRDAWICHERYGLRRGLRFRVMPVNA